MFAVHAEAVKQSPKNQHQRPEGKLLQAAMKAQRISGRALADMVGLSEGRVRQIVNGYRTEAGVTLEIVGPVDTVARMAEALKVSADSMEEAGRPDVAAEIRTMPRVGLTEEGDLWISDNSEETQALRDWLDGGEDNTSPPVSALALWEHDELLAAASRKHHEEMRLLNIVVQMKRGGDGDADSTGGAAPIDVDKEGLSEVDDSLAAAAKKQGLQGSGEEGSI